MTSGMSSLAAVEERLVAPGAPFELIEEEVLGEQVRVFKNRPRTLRDVLLSAREFAQREYLVFREENREHRLTFAEHEAQVRSIAEALREQFDVGPGDRVAIVAANRPEWIVSFWATVSLGAICVGMNAWWTAEEIRLALENSQPKLLLSDRTRASRIDASRLAVPVLIVEDALPRLLEEHPGIDLPTDRIRESDPAIILYTSGTTGRAKGVVHTHANVTNMIMVSFWHGARLMMADPGQAELPELPNTVLVTSPLFHVSGLHCAAVTALAGGAKTVWPMGRFDPAVTLSLIERERVTGWGYTSTVLRRLLRHPRIEDYDMSSLRSVGGGGSPIPKTLIDRARRLWPQCKLTMGVGYGLTEGTAFATLQAGEELHADASSVGRPVPVVDVEIRDAEGQALPDGAEGEIHLRGPLVMKGYWNDPEATREVIKEGRWLKTGDVGVIREGRLYVESRKRDLILRGGENVYPAEIELRLELHPAVLEAAIIGVASDEYGQEVKAIVVTDGRAPSAVELEAWVAETLAYYKVPRVWEFRTEPLPRNATGKVLKEVLRQAETSRFIEE